ncbi:hypothetical protein [Wolbachia endosymbiont of Mansonella ozzardi]|uniref:hypothetical protein n=1 Tax=Wolbachia endosymbiont of Mansonella ozzardi TaxID=137464 RepID=UPI001CE140F9|nr:hypothetical protein [Wolbachia endosymbiont of Mansonella ozzardi]
MEVLLPYLSDEEKGRMLQSIAYSDHEETDHDIEIVKLLLNADADPGRFIQHSDPKKKSKFVKLCNEYKKSIMNNPQKQSSGGRRIIIVPTLLFGSIGAAFAAMGIIPEITAIVVIATAILSGIADAVIGGTAEYLVDIAMSQCCGNQQCAA